MPVASAEAERNCEGVCIISQLKKIGFITEKNLHM